MISNLPIGPRMLFHDCNHSANAIFWRFAILFEEGLNRSDRKTKQRAAGGVGSDLVVGDIDCSQLRGL